MALVKSLMHFENRESISKWVQYQDNYGLEVLGEAILAEITRRENKEQIPDRLELALSVGTAPLRLVSSTSGIGLTALLRWPMKSVGNIGSENG